MDRLHVGSGEAQTQTLLQENKREVRERERERENRKKGPSLLIIGALVGIGRCPSQIVIILPHPHIPWRLHNIVHNSLAYSI